MKKIAYLTFFLFGLIASVLVTPANVYGQENCTPIYGGGVDCPEEDQLTVDKTVQYPETNSFVDNITINDRRFVSGEYVVYQLTVKNTSNEELHNVQVRVCS